MKKGDLVRFSLGISGLTINRNAFTTSAKNRNTVIRNVNRRSCGIILEDKINIWGDKYNKQRVAFKPAVRIMWSTKDIELLYCDELELL